MTPSTSPWPRRALLLALALPLACASSSPMQRPDEPLIDERGGDPAAAAASPAPPPAGPALAPPPAAAAPVEPALDAGSPPGTIRRDHLKAVLAGSPGAFLARVDSEPAFSGATFRGWRIRSFYPGDLRLGGALRPGDVVLRVNDHAIERPEQFSEVWQGAGARADLTVDLVREGRPLRLAWRIVEPPGATPAAPSLPPAR